MWVESGQQIFHEKITLVNEFDRRQNNENCYSRENTKKKFNLDYKFNIEYLFLNVLDLL